MSTSQNSFFSLSLVERINMKKRIYFILLGTFIVSCSPKTTEVATEPVSEKEMPTSDIAEGKVVLLKNCAKCHEMKPIHDYTSGQWTKILPEMIKKSRLNEEEARQITAYVNWELTQK